MHGACNAAHKTVDTFNTSFIHPGSVYKRPLFAVHGTDLRVNLLEHSGLLSTQPPPISLRSHRCESLISSGILGNLLHLSETFLLTVFPGDENYPFFERYR